MLHTLLKAYWAFTGIIDLLHMVTSLLLFVYIRNVFLFMLINVSVVRQKNFFDFSNIRIKSYLNINLHYTVTYTVTFMLNENMT